MASAVVLIYNDDPAYLMIGYNECAVPLIFFSELYIARNKFYFRIFSQVNIFVLVFHISLFQYFPEWYWINCAGQFPSFCTQNGNSPFPKLNPHWNKFTQVNYFNIRKNKTQVQDLFSNNYYDTHVVITARRHIPAISVPWVLSCWALGPWPVSSRERSPTGIRRLYAFFMCFIISISWKF